MAGWLRGHGDRHLSSGEVEQVRGSVRWLVACVPKLAALHSRLQAAVDRLAGPLRFEEAVDVGQQAARLLLEAETSVRGVWIKVWTVISAIAGDDPMVRAVDWEEAPTFLRGVRQDEGWRSSWFALEAAMPEAGDLPEDLLMHRDALEIQAWRALALLPGAVMRRGYALVTQPGGGALADVDHPAPGDRLTIHHCGDRLTVQVVVSESEPLPEPGWIAREESFWRYFMGARGGWSPLSTERSAGCD